MTRDEIICMARDAGSIDSEEVIDTVWNAFSAVEREECAKVCEIEAKAFEQLASGSHDGQYDWKADGAMDCAAAIRVRGEKE